MQNGLAQRYAQSFLAVAKQKNIVSVIEKDLALISDNLKEQPAFGEFLSSPVYKREQKTELVSRVYGSAVDPLTLNLLGLLIRNWRAEILADVLTVFGSLLDVERGIKRATIVSARPLDAKQLNAIDQALSKQYNSHFQWQTEVDPSLVAGFRVRIEDTVIDHSLSLKLKELEKQLLAKA